MPKLTPCPREDCTADVRHWHNHAGATFACTNTKRKWCRKQHIDVAHPCHLPHVPASSQVKTADNPAPIVLPTVDEVADVLRSGDGLRFYSDSARDILDLIATRLPVWQPVEPGTVIKAGTVTRIELDDRDAHEEVTRSDYTLIDLNRYPGHLVRFYLDPRTVPAEPVDPRAELLAEELHKLVADFQANGNSRELGDPAAGAWLEAAQQVLDALNNQADR